MEAKWNMDKYWKCIQTMLNRAELTGGSHRCYTELRARTSKLQYDTTFWYFAVGNWLHFSFFFKQEKKERSLQVMQL